MVTYQVIALVLPICQDEYQWTSRRDRYRPLPPLHRLPQNRFKATKPILPWEESGTESQISHSPLLQHPTDRIVPKSKEYAQRAGKVGSQDACSFTHSVKRLAAASEASFLLSTESESKL